LSASEAKHAGRYCHCTACSHGSSSHAYIPLKEHLPVHIGYWTAWVNADGSVTYTDDPYKLDEKQADVEHLTLA
jgi:murein L,D-transpeptidase YcbB/YkuD